METYTYELSIEHSFPNIAVYRKMEDGVLCAWRVETDKGYVMYNPNEPQIGYDDNDNEIEVYFYYGVKLLTLNFDFSSFPWVAVLRDSVDEKYIFSGGNND